MTLFGFSTFMEKIEMRNIKVFKFSELPKAYAATVLEDAPSMNADGRYWFKFVGNVVEDAAVDPKGFDPEYVEIYREADVFFYESGCENGESILIEQD